INDPAGFPAVPPINHTSVNRFIAVIVLTITMNTIIGRKYGMVIYSHILYQVAPSTSAASYKSRGTLDIAAMNIIVLYPSIPHKFINTILNLEIEGFVNQPIGSIPTHPST